MSYARKSDFEIVALDRQAVWIVDLDCGGPSVTNDAERVCRCLHAEYPGRRIFYRDTMGNWDELDHAAGTFRGYKPGCEPCRP